MNREEFLKLLTVEQRAAVENIDEKVSVTANAGSGKTKMMVTKYLYLLLFYPEKYNYKNIVAITFTKKAASEILSKIRNEINGLIQGEFELTDQQLELLNEVNRNLMSLNVGTIHSFCRRIVRDFGYKINLQSNVNIIDEVEKDIILEKLIHQVLSSKSKQNQINEDIRRAIFYLGFDDTVSTIKGMIGKKNYFDKQKKNYNRPLKDFLIDFRGSKFNEIKGIINFTLKNLDTIEYNEKHVDKIKSLKSIFANILEKVKNDKANLEEISNLMKESRAIKYGRPLLLKSIIGEKKDKYWQELYDKLPEYRDIDFILENRYNLIKSLIAIGEKVSENYKSYSIENNLMDNDDTINYAVELLQYDTVKRLLRFEIKYLMIDEFQDTDDRQLEIAEKLGEDNSVRIFVVGDDKQSIYSFRDADVRVFKRFRQKYSKNTLELNVSFRAVHHLNCFVNRYYKPIMNSDNSIYDVDYQKITSSSLKGHGEDKHKEININFSYNSKIFDKSEEVMALKTIHNLLEKGAKLEDICVLSGKASNLLALSKALKEKGIPSYVTSSSGFFNRNEIKDLIAYLQFIDNPDNDFLLAATLKSALFNYSDKMLYEFKKSGKKSTFWEYLKSEKKKGNHLLDDKTYEVITNSIELSNKLPITNLIMKIVDESNWNYYYNTSIPERSAVFRNLYKFMDFVRAVERRDYTNLSDLFLYLDKMFLSNRMSEEYGNTSGHITMSTIHSAKGLEYKHLILLNYELQPSKGKSNNLVIDENYGPILNTPKSVDSFENFGKSKTFIDDYISTEEKLKREAENIRLSYVAMTRASESIDIISPLSSGSQQDVWDSFEQGLSKIITNQKTEINRKDREEIHKEIISYEYKDNIDCYDIETKDVKQIKSSYKVNFDFSEYEKEDFNFDNFVEKQTKTNISDYTLNLDSVDVKERFMQFTATKLNKFIQSEATNENIFKEIYVYGLPNIEERLKQLNAESSNQYGISGTKFGSLFHQVMERVVLFIDEDMNLNRESLKEVVTELYTNESHEVLESALSLVNESIVMLLSNDFIKSNSEVLLNSKREFELKAMFGTHILHGEIDLLHIDNEKAFIWDWKTNQIKNSEDLKNAANSYELQMKLYALLVFKYDDSIQTVETNLLFVRNISANKENWIVSKTFTRSDMTNISIEISEKIGGIDSTYGHIYPIEQMGLIKE